MGQLYEKLVGLNLLITIDLSPHLTSPVGEGLVTLSCDYQLVINIRSNQHLPNGGEREGAEVSGKEYNTDDNHRIITLAPT